MRKTGHFMAGKYPPKKKVKEHLDFLNAVTSNDYIQQCDDCTHSRNVDFATKWCELYEHSPVGLCLDRKPIPGTTG